MTFLIINLIDLLIYFTVINFIIFNYYFMHLTNYQLFFKFHLFIIFVYFNPYNLLNLFSQNYLLFWCVFSVSIEAINFLSAQNLYCHLNFKIITIFQINFLLIYLLIYLNVIEFLHKINQKLDSFIAVIIIFNCYKFMSYLLKLTFFKLFHQLQQEFINFKLLINWQDVFTLHLVINIIMIYIHFLDLSEAQSFFLIIIIMVIIFSHK